MSSVYGLSFSKEGKDPGSNDPRDLVWSSEFNTLSIWKQDQVTLSYTNNGTGYNDATISHGLSFIPTFLVYCNIFGGSTRHPTDGVGSSITRCYADNQYIRIRYTSTVTVYYYVFSDAAQVSATQTEVPDSSSYGLKVSKEGRDVTSNYLEDIIFSTNYPPLKLHNIYTIEAEYRSNRDFTTRVEHGLGFTPAFLAYLEIPDQAYKEMLPFTFGSIICDVWSDGTYINAYTDNTFGSSSGTLDFKVIVFADRAAK